MTITEYKAYVLAQAVQLIDVAHATTSPTISPSVRFREFVRDHILVHGLSLTSLPHPRGRISVGRRDSILISADGVHLAHVTSPPYVSALFVFEPFLGDIEAAFQSAFQDAAGVTPRGTFMEDHIRNHGPVVGLAPLTFIDPTCPPRTGFAAAASGAPWP